MKLLKALSIFITLAAIPLASCNHDEPSTSLNQPINNPTNPETPKDDATLNEIQGAKILGTWYYLNPNKALKITITFKSDEAKNFAIFGERVAIISVESEFPYYHEDYSNVWSYNSSKWEVTRLAIGPNISSSAIITQVFDNEMWLDLNWDYAHKERLKFKRSDPGDPVKPVGFQLAPDGIFGTYVWNTKIDQYNLTFQFKDNIRTHETSDYDVMVFVSEGDYKYLKETNGDGIFSNGYLKVSWNASLVAAVAGSPYFVVIHDSDKILKLYNPLKPDIVYTFHRD